MKKRFCLGLLIWSLFWFWGIAQQSFSGLLVIDPGDVAYQEGRYFFRDQLYIFIDSIADRPLEEVTSPSFQNHFYHDTTGFFKNWIADMGPDKACVWARLTIDSRLAEKEEWVTQISAGEVDFFAPRGNGQFFHQRTGTSLAVKQKALGGSYGALACVALTLPAQDTLTVYFKLREVNSSIGNKLIAEFDRSVFKPQVFAAKVTRIRFFEILSIGILLAVAIYHLIIFFYQRQTVSLFFGLFVLILAIVLFSYGGYFNELVAPGISIHYGASIISMWLGFASVFHYLFSRKYLNLSRILPAWDRLWGALILLQLMLVVLFAWTMVSAGGPENADPAFAYKIVLLRVLSPLPILLLAMVAAFRAYLKGNKAARLYMLAMSAYIFQHLANQAGFNEIIHIPGWVFVFSGEAVTSLIFAVGIASQLRTLQQEKMAAEQAELRLKDLDAFKTRFYTNITHQFRTPLTIILGMADQIRAHPSSWLNKGTEMIQRNGRRLLHLVSQILDLSKLEAGQMPVNLVCDDVIQYLKYIVESFHSLAEQKWIDLRFESDTSKLAVDYDPDKLMDILSNLISNALKFTPEGGRVEVRAEVVKEKEEQLLICVKDNGPGIPEDALDKVFDRFFQADTGQGSGIGLALTRELVHLLQGEISVKSQPGEGAEFLVTLPITRTASLGQQFDPKAIKDAALPYLHPENNQPFGDTLPTASTLPTLLIVEDSTDVVTYLQAVLSLRFQLKIAVNGKEGLAKARQFIPDLIVSDIMMPEMDGMEMCRQLKTDTLTSHIPIILLTAKADQPSRVEGLRTGADAYLAKPFDKAELLVRIDKLIELRAKLQERYRDIRFLFALKNTSTNDDHPQDHFMRDVQRIIEDHLGDPGFDVPQLCRELGMSRSQCYQKFKALTGQSPADLIRRIRLHKARQLLGAGRLNVSQVAAEVGFRNLSTFSRSFKEEFGVRPREV